MNNAQTRTYLEIAEGNIGPEARVASGEIREETVNRLEADVRTGKFYRQLPEGIFIPFLCVDGRLGAVEMGPNAAGGTFSIVMGDALTGKTLAPDAINASVHATTIFTMLLSRGHRIGGHDDNHAHGPNCGCGAQDKLDNTDFSQPSIMGYIDRRGADIRSNIETLGIVVSDDIHDKIMGENAKLRSSGYATNGANLRQVFVDTAGEKSVVTLRDYHHEVLLVINTQESTTLDREAMAEDYLDEIQVFNLDAWALKKSWDEIALTPEEAHAKYVASLYYNVATAAVLADTSMRVVIR